MEYLTCDDFMSYGDYNYQQKVILLRIFERYHQEVKRIKISKIPLPLGAKYLSRFPFVFMVENAFRNCCEETQQIITKDFIEPQKGKWYAKEMSAATYYRRRANAYEEFVTELF